MGESRTENADKPGGEKQPTEAASQCQEDVFRQELPKDSPLSCSKRTANCDFFFAGDCASELQAGDIGAGDEKNKSHGAEQNQQSRP